MVNPMKRSGIDVNSVKIPGLHHDLARLGSRNRTHAGGDLTLDADATRPELQRLLAAPAHGDPERDFILRSSAASALLSQGDERGREALHRMLARADSRRRLPLLQLLAPVARAADIDAIAPLLTSDDDALRVQAAAIYWKVGR